ncbi:hypothetical protein LPA44_14165 [Halobacterium sp. KA-4]|uniref:hypothetical protein n=1 Tax=Halobacterium sp. KA-4 TaxID=2896367 RepID=UPI001E537C35|nr:hypothetical protein [Halobacterium sp. KA-4]MCD2201029.1 hypothetical protein [Halobacterium sp. KA-4]
MNPKDEMFKSLPSNIQETLRAIDDFEKQMALAEVIYHILPGPDRQLDKVCTATEVHEVVPGTKQTARNHLNDLVDLNILEDTNPEQKTFHVHPHIQTDRNVSNRSNTLVHDGGSIHEQLPDFDNPLFNPADGNPIKPTIATIFLLIFSAPTATITTSLGAVDPSSALIAGLLLTSTWLTYELAKIPTEYPRHTAHELHSRLQRLNLTP